MQWELRLKEERTMRFTVKDVMTTQVVSVNGNTPFKD